MPNLDHDTVARTDPGYCVKFALPEEAAELADRLGAHPGAWVTFRTGFDLDLNHPYSNHATPHAIYGLDADRIATFARDYAARIASAKSASAKAQLKHHSFHALGYTRRPDAVVFSVDGRLLASDSYVANVEDWERLRAYVGAHYPEADSIVERWKPKRDYDHYMSFRWALWMTEKTADRIVGADGDGDEVYRTHPDKPRVWRELVRAAGFDAIVDRSHVLTGDSDHEIAVVNPDRIRVLAAFHNPAAAGRPERDMDRPSIPGAAR